CSEGRTSYPAGKAANGQGSQSPHSCQERAGGPVGLRPGVFPFAALTGVLALPTITFSSTGPLGRVRLITEDENRDGPQEARTGTQEPLPFLHEGWLSAAGLRR